MLKSWKFHTWLMRIKNNAATLENKLAISHKGEHTVVILTKILSVVLKQEK
jgi:hypothetical protein